MVSNFTTEKFRITENITQIPTVAEAEVLDLAHLIEERLHQTFG